MWNFLQRALTVVFVVALMSSAQIAYADDSAEQQIQKYSAEIEKDPNNVDAYCSLGNVYLNAQQYDSAIQVLAKAVELNPNLETAYYYRALAYYNTEQFELALQDFNKAIELNPENKFAHIFRAEVYQQLMIQDYTKILELDPTLYDIYIKRANYYAEVANYPQAISDLTAAINVAPHVGELYKLRGDCHQKFGDKDRAKIDYAKAKQLGYKF